MFVDRHGRRQLPERLHLPDPLAEERDLAGLALPACCTAIAARDNIPIVSWLALRGECRTAARRSRRAIRWSRPWSACSSWALYRRRRRLRPREMPGADPGLRRCSTLAYHAILVALLVAATFIDYDLTIIPDEITVTGMVLGLGAGDARSRDPARARRTPRRTAAGLLGRGARAARRGGADAGRSACSARGCLRREAMGFGDVTLMAMIGAFLGWQAAVLTFFLGPFFGLAHALWKLVQLSSRNG